MNTVHDQERGFVKGIFHEVTLRQAIRDTIDQGRGFYDLRVFPQPTGGPDENALLSVTLRAQPPLLVTGRVIGTGSAPNLQVLLSKQVTRSAFEVARDQWIKSRISQEYGTTGSPRMFGGDECTGIS
jgi:hypothetical protein